MQLVNYKLKFRNKPEKDKADERQADLNLEDKLKEEASGILAWIVQGAINYYEEGLNPPQEVLDAVAEYRRAEDVTADFEDECTEKAEGLMVQASDLYKAFRGWYKDLYASKPMSQTKFGKIMKKKYESEKVGNWRYYGIALNERGAQMLELAVKILEQDKTW